MRGNKEGRNINTNINRQQYFSFHFLTTFALPKKNEKYIKPFLSCEWEGSLT
jgi:hypothetical protein